MTENNQEVEPVVSKKTKSLKAAKALIEEVQVTNNKENKNTKIISEIARKEPISDLEGRFIHVKVGDQYFPATDENDMVGQVQKQLDKILEEAGIDCTVFVSHHAVEMRIVG